MRLAKSPQTSLTKMRLAKSPQTSLTKMRLAKSPHTSLTKMRWTKSPQRVSQRWDEQSLPRKSHKDGMNKVSPDKFSHFWWKFMILELIQPNSARIWENKACPRLLGEWHWPGGFQNAKKLPKIGRWKSGNFVKQCFFKVSELNFD